MIQRTVLAGPGDTYVRLSYRQGNRSYVDAVAGFYGAHLTPGPATLKIGNGDYAVLLNVADSVAVERPDDRDAIGATRFTAPLLEVPKRLPGFRAGHRVHVLILPMAAYDFQNPRQATQAVMHTTRDLHGPGPYPETTRWGAWINGYRAAAAARAAARVTRH